MSNLSNSQIRASTEKDAFSRSVSPMETKGANASPTERRPELPRHDQATTNRGWCVLRTVYWNGDLFQAHANAEKSSV